MGCKGSDEQRYTRHKQIAGILKEISEVNGEKPVLTPKSATFSRDAHTGSPSTITKKLRKAAKAAEKAAVRPAIITEADIKRVGDILHPRGPIDEEFEKALLMDKSIADNLFYHPGTANSYDMREWIIKQERSGKVGLKVSGENLDQIITELLPNWNKSKSKKERNLIARLRKMVEEDLTHDHGEEQQIMMRKASFWRWANREAYNRLAANGRIWDWKSGEALAPVVERQADAADDESKAEVPEVDATGTGETDEGTRNEKDDAVVDEGEGGEDVHATSVLLRGLSLASESSRTRLASSSSVSRNTSASSASRTTVSSADENTDSFVRVGKPRPARLVIPAPVLRFSANGGLGHLLSRSTPRAPGGPMSAYSMLAVEDADDGDDDEDYEAISPRTPCPRRRFM